MSNYDTSVTLRYHGATNHSQQSLSEGPHFLDWANHPIPYKIYPTLEPIPLPADFTPSAVPALDAIASSSPAVPHEHNPDLQALARLCFFSNGIPKIRRRPSADEFALR